MNHLDELLELEHAGWRALCDGTGGAFYDAHMTRDGLMVLPHGAVLDREGVAASLEGAPPWAGYEIIDPRLLELGGGARALVYTGRAWRNDGTGDFRALMSSVYVRSEEGWRLALYQQTPVHLA